MRNTEQLNKLVKFDKILGKKSMEIMKEQKLKSLKDLRSLELQKEKEHLVKKENELLYWKNKYESQLVIHN